MEKKVYYQNGLRGLRYLGYALCLAIIGGFVFAIVWFFVGKMYASGQGWALFVGSLITIPIISFVFVRAVTLSIVLDADKIYVRRWLSGGRGRHYGQYDVRIPYTDIKKIFMVSSKVDENAYYESPLIVFERHSGGHQAKVNVQFYAKKRVIEIIDEVAKRAWRWQDEAEFKSGAEIFENYLHHKEHKKKK